MKRYSLPELDYSYDALEPFMSKRQLELHHTKHHANYVKQANELSEKLETARKAGDMDAVGAIENKLAFNVSGHVMHSLLWKNLKPNAPAHPAGKLAEAIVTEFGSFDAFKKEFTHAAETLMGSGWAALVWEQGANRLAITQIQDHQHNVIQQSRFLMVMDAWEHAYYLQYENRKQEFFAAMWNVIDWTNVSERFSVARV